MGEKFNKKEDGKKEKKPAAKPTANQANAKKPISEPAMSQATEKRALQKAIEIMGAWASAPGNPAKSNNWAQYAAEGRNDVREVLDAVKRGGKKAGGHIITANLWDAGYDYDDSRGGHSMRALCDASSFIEGQLTASDFLKKLGEGGEDNKESAKECNDVDSVALCNKHKDKIEQLKSAFKGMGQFGNAETYLNVDLMIKVFEQHPSASDEVVIRMRALRNYGDVTGFNATFELFNEMTDSSLVRSAAHILGEIASLAHAPWKYMEVVELLKANVKDNKMLRTILDDDEIEYPGQESLDKVLKKYKKK